MAQRTSSPWLSAVFLAVIACDAGEESSGSTSTAGAAASGGAAGQGGSGGAKAGSGGAAAGAAGAGASGAGAAAGKNTAGAGGSTVAGAGGSAAGGAGGGGGSGGPACGPEKPPVVVCDDWTDLAGVWSTYAEDGAPSKTTIEATGSWGSALAGSAVRVETGAGFAFHARLELAAPVSAAGKDRIQLALKASNTSPNGWQINGPVLTLEDAEGKRRKLTPAGQHLPTDGASWARVEAPLAGGSGWKATGDAIDPEKLRAVEIGADTWDAGFWFVVDALALKNPGELCAVSCENGCSGVGECDPEKLRCACPLGTTADDCGACAEGFAGVNGACALAVDGDHDEWPNQTSKANSDPWLRAHEGKIKVVRPKVLVVHFPNHQAGKPTSDLPGSKALVDSVIAGFREGSRARGYADPGAPPQLEYEVARFVDARDGVDGRPPAPAGYPYENSTFFPRIDLGGTLRLDYGAFFGDKFAQLYGYTDPADPAHHLRLCELIERGEVHELWMVGSGDVPDAAAAEVLEAKQRYTAEGNKIPGLFDRCAGNGCFDVSVPTCSRSVRIGFINYTRGPGCYLHSQGHGIESFGRRGAVPGLSEWLVPFAGFDLDTRYGLPFQDLYAVGCASKPCLSYPGPSSLEVDQGGKIHDVDPYDGRCGNVHFPPNGRDHYDYGNAAEVLSSCEGFGRNEEGCGEDKKGPVSAATWAGYEALSPDCGGAFLIWWYQNMPGYGSGQSLPDGRPMTPVWPALFY